MGSDWRPSVYPPPHCAGTTLPSVAELLSSSSAADEPSCYLRDSAVPPAPVDRPSTRSTPPAAPRLDLSPSQPSSLPARSHASPHVSPTDCRIPPADLEQSHLHHHRHHHPPPQSIAPPATSTATCEASRNLQDATRSQLPITSLRQDSAISQQRFEPKDLQPSAPSANFNFSYSSQGPDGNLTATSPRPHSHSISPTSPQLPTPDSHLPQASSPSTSQSSKRGHAKSSSLGTQPDMESAKSQEHVLGTSSKSAGADLGTAPANASTAEQAHYQIPRPRFNVRFMANYTSEDMRTAQKPRQEPSPVVSTSAENSKPEPTTEEQPLSPSIEPSTQTVAPKTQPAEDASHAHQRRRESSVERCPGCNEAWKRPLPDTDSYRQDSPAENSKDLSRLSMNLIAHLQAHQRKADAMYDRWKWKHSHCVPQDEYEPGPSSPSFTEPQDGLHNTAGDRASQATKISETISNKRKSELSHEDNQQINSKFRKVSFEGSSTAAPLVRPSAPV